MNYRYPNSVMRHELLFQEKTTLHLIVMHIRLIDSQKTMISFAWPSDKARIEAIRRGEYISKNNIPIGLEIWREKLFVTLARSKPGVASTLNYIPLHQAWNKNASLIPYPDWERNTLPKRGVPPKDDAIISTHRIKADACDRLWLLDTGAVDTLGEFIVYRQPSVVIYDLKTDELIRRYYLKQEDLNGPDTSFVNIGVDVNPEKCNEAYAYLPDIGGFGIVVYSYAQNDSWRVKNNYFHFDPLQGNFDAAGAYFQSAGGVISVTLGNPDRNWDRTMYFHAFASSMQFSVNTRVLKNRTLALDPFSYQLYKVEGDKGGRSQTSTAVFDAKSNVIFFSQILKDGFACWNTEKPLNPENIALVAQDHEKLVFVGDLKIDLERNIWIISNKLSISRYNDMNPDEINYRIYKIPVDDAIKGTVCETRNERQYYRGPNYFLPVDN
ncbi:hypothetical protein NQ317_002852 [Molorchus minor]|uniref:Uncharacterized protein n=1 Tax=Molorchus minor TaxID=1323400 RepID=A0ABQ9JUZ7_9CUCU|nr:hypothetical protein NQ317_002852 [Molorchus minor]